ncbi:unnamed protein product [Withania somnifera]
MPRACVIDFGGTWDQHLPLVEFAYNNGYHSGIEMAPFEALYGRRCRSPIGWFEGFETKIRSTYLLRDSLDQVRLIRDRPRAAQSRQKSYADRRLRALEFGVGDKVFLRVSPMRGVMRFGRRGKLSPRFIGPYEVLERVSDVAYRLSLPPILSPCIPYFMFLSLRRYMPDESHVIREDSVKPDGNLSFMEEPVRILAKEVRKLRSGEIPVVKVRWSHRSIEEATWEIENEVRK